MRILRLMGYFSVSFLLTCAMLWVGIYGVPNGLGVMLASAAGY